MREVDTPSPAATHLSEPHATPKQDDVSGMNFNGAQLEPPSELYARFTGGEGPPAIIIFLDTVVEGGAYVVGPVR
jgi:hypothetical protein